MISESTSFVEERGSVARELGRIPTRLRSTESGLPLAGKAEDLQSRFLMAAWILEVDEEVR